MLKLKHNTARIAIYFLCIVLVLFVAVKSSSASFTHDESLSYNHFVNQGFMDIVSYATPSTNNHLLNTLMMKLSYSVWGTSALALRLHSIVALVLYLFACTQLLRGVPSTLKLSCLILFIANPYLIDFFGLARGYGLAIGCMMMALYYVYRWIKSATITHLLLFNVFALLAAYSNFSMINFYLSAFCAVNLVYILKSSTIGNGRRTTFIYWLKMNAVNISFMLLTAFLLWEPIRKITRQHMLDFGGTSDVVTDTICSIISASFYHLQVPAVWALVLSWCVALVIFIILSAWVYSVAKSKAHSDQFYLLVIVNSTLAGVLILITAQHFILKNDYFVGRFALFLYPLFILNIVFTAALLYKKYNGHWSAFFLGIVSVLCALNFLVNVNMHSYLDWEYDMDTKQMLLYLERSNKQDNGGMPIQLGITWLYEPTIDFYRNTHSLSWLLPANQNGVTAAEKYFT